MGPATSSDERLKELVASGMDVARMNFSHGKHEDHAAVYARVRKASDAAEKAVGILADLQGPKIRLGRFDGCDGATVWETGEEVRITVEDVEGTHDRVSTTYKQLSEDASPGDRLLVDDGKVGLTVASIDGTDVVCTVTEGGPVSNNKGLSLPGMSVSVPALSEKDIADLEFALNLGVDLVALSFVRSPSDIELVHEVMDRVGRRVPVIAKLEKPEAIENLEAIVLAFDAIMVARGDLGVELPLEQVPLVQKRAIQMARETAKPVIVATQMLDSMIENSRPTRAEASDVAADGVGAGWGAQGEDAARGGGMARLLDDQVARSAVEPGEHDGVAVAGKPLEPAVKSLVDRNSRRPAAFARCRHALGTIVAIGPGRPDAPDEDHARVGHRGAGILAEFNLAFALHHRDTWSLPAVHISCVIFFSISDLRLALKRNSI